MNIKSTKADNGGGKQHRMANVKLKDATKELVEEASGILEEATRIRKEADSLFETLKRMDPRIRNGEMEQYPRKSRCPGL